MENIGLVLYQFVINLLNIVVTIWEWFSTPIVFNGVNILGWQMIPSFTFTPIYISGGVLVIILLMGVISLFNPNA